MKNLTKLTVFLLFFLFTCSVFLSNKARVLNAAEAYPPPYVACDEEVTRNPEFNSQRPYQASPCGSSIKAVYCMNDYRLEVTVDRKYGPKCREQNGHYVCPHDEWFDHDYEIFLSGAEYPIAGNTEDTLNDAEKMNEYLNWYLSGTTTKAEVGVDSPERIVNFSGPTKKLLPSVIQELQRFRILHEAGVKLTYTDSEEFKDPSLDTNSNQEGIQVDETFDHNQIVVCTAKNFFGIRNPFLGAEVPIPCSNKSTQDVSTSPIGTFLASLGNAVGKLTGNKEYRLVEWWEGKQTNLMDIFKIIPDWNPYFTRWGATTPPFPWQFEKDVYYQKAYQEWRGRECLLLPGDKLVCGDLKIPGVVEWHTNIWADLYQYIPLGTTVDKNAQHAVTGVSVKGQGDTIVDETPAISPTEKVADGYVVEQNPALFYPHSQSSYDILDILNKSHTPEELVEGKQKTSALPADVEPNTCEVVDVRTNPGDDLTFDNTKDKNRVYITGVKFHVSQIECGSEVTRWVDECGTQRPNALLNDDPSDDKCARWPNCKGTVTVTIPTNPKIPYAEQIFDKSVAGQASAFRKIFPKIEEGAPVECIANIPGVSNVDYTAELPEATKLRSINTPLGWVGPDEAQLFFPYLGSVYEYFLNGIQTALRPQGYGEPITNGKLCQIGQKSGDCSFDLQQAYAAIDAAAAKYNIDAEILRGVFEWESGPYIADPSTYQCTEENSAGAIGVAQMKKGTYDMLTCGSEKLDNDIGVCEDPRNGAMSRCYIPDAIELMARLLLLQAHKLNNCQSTGSLTLANKPEWWAAVCGYLGGFGSTGSDNVVLTNYENSIPTSQRPVGRHMTYCDAICHRMGQCPSYPPLP